MQDLTLCIIQFDIAWCDYQANIERIDSKLTRVNQQFDILVLPETFSSGFVMDPTDVAQEMSGPMITWMTSTAQKRKCHVMGSLAISDDGHFYNRLVCAHDDGTISYYDKRHLFSYAGESDRFTAGSHRLELTIKGWKLCPLICYDLRFPAWSRNTTDYDALIYVANWPSARVGAWSALLRARAIENLCYTIGVNRSGQDGNGITYPGASQGYNVAGFELYKAGSEEEVILTTLTREPLEDFRKSYNFLADRDIYTIE